MEMNLIPRPVYQELLMRSVRTPMIKILVGMRRTGKSMLMKLFIQDLIESGIDSSSIYYRKFDDELEAERPGLRGLIDDVKSKIDVVKGSFILLDEMQDIDGWERAVESFYDAGANVVFHSDYPVSPMMNVKYSIYTAEKRTYPQDLYGDLCKPRNTKEAITREQSLRAMTINVARQWHQEHRMGSIEFGKIANMTVFDCDFLHDDIEKVAQANIVATIVDGEVVFKAE